MPIALGVNYTREIDKLSPFAVNLNGYYGAYSSGFNTQIHVYLHPVSSYSLYLGGGPGLSRMEGKYYPFYTPTVIGTIGMEMFRKFRHPSKLELQFSKNIFKTTQQRNPFEVWLTYGLGF